ncbi:Putative glycosidase [Nitrosotalea devaniterrae]|uniref:Glycosidase n=1 Tax=Nitrosotalea devaniterrae TaxID=1078905 RepID=A0A128A0S8_9ARCH|nr:Putative glycosidase [Candidatus Nitrosotalea devanaterra]
MKDVQLALDSAVKFLLGPSSIDDSTTKAKSGFYGFQNTTKPMRETDKPFIFYEISGYGINLLLKLYKWYNDPKFLDLAKKTGESILLGQVNSNNPKTNGAFFDRFYPDSGNFFETFHVYPNAVCAGALCELYHETKDKRFLESARKTTKWLFEMLERKDDKCIGFKEFFSQSEKSDKVYPYESICIPFILLKFQNDLEISEEQKKDLDSAISWGVQSQTSEGVFPFFYQPLQNKFNETAYSHFTIYPLYNLMGFPLSELEDMGQRGCFAAFQKCVNWLTKVQDVDGGFYTYYHKDGHVWHKQSPPIGQALCSFVHLYEKTGEKKFLDAATKAANWLVTNQLKDSQFAGAFYWVYPNKHLSGLQKKIAYAKERVVGKISSSEYVSDVTVLLDKIPIWPVQFAIEGLYRFNNLQGLS